MSKCFITKLFCAVTSGPSLHFWYIGVLFLESGNTFNLKIVTDVFTYVPFAGKSPVARQPAMQPIITEHPSLWLTWISFLGAWKSFSQSHNRFVSACLCIEVLHIECYLCINATCVIVRGICDLCICALLYIVFLYRVFLFAIQSISIQVLL